MIFLTLYVASKSISVVSVATVLVSTGVITLTVDL
jgi:hypothetical protein